MENTPENERSFSEGYQGYTIQQPAQPYGQEEMPQSTYPQQGAASYGTSEEQAYGQQQYYEQTPSHAGQAYRQQQYYYGQQQQQQHSTQPGFGNQQPGFGQNPNYGQQQHYTQSGFGNQQSSAGQHYYYGQQQQQYHAHPGAGQRMAGDVGSAERTDMGMNVRTAAILSYVFGWIGGLVFLIMERKNRFVRFHAMQSVILFGAFSIIQLAFGLLVFGFFNFLGAFNMFEWAFGYLAFLGLIRNALGLFMFVSWIVLIITAGKGRYYKLPVIGDLAEKLLVKLH